MGKYEYVNLQAGTLLNPTPVVLVSCAAKDAPEKKDMVTLAWAGTINSDPPMVSISVRKERYSHDMIQKSGEFVVNLVDEDMCKAVDRGMEIGDVRLLKKEGGKSGTWERVID